ncbi:MAG: DUF2914 domain-containing protein [Gammaproteobacteria bacterium]
MANNRVIIKINYDKDKRRKQLIDPKMVTVWHTRRILGAISILVLLVILVTFGLSNDNPEEKKPPAPAKIETVSPKVLSEAPIETNITPKAIAEQQNKITPLPQKSNIAETSEAADSKATKLTKPPAIIFDKKVIRASLNTAPRYGEPGDPVKPLVEIAPNETKELFYFSEIKNMQEKILFHQWFNNDKLIYKKQFNVKTNKSKLISSKKLNSHEQGEWRVTLIDANKKVLSEVNFSVNR